MAELSPQEQEKLRKLEEEVDREREAARKKREELEKRALVAVPDPGQKTAPVATPEESQSTALASGNEWKRSMRRKIAIGTAVGLTGLVVLNNIGTLIACALIAGAVYYASGKYLADEPAPKETGEQKKT
jgi:hypothetical protein